jgi:hypothetical protein
MNFTTNAKSDMATEKTTCRRYYFIYCPIRERIIDILEDDLYLAKVARMGAEKARDRHQKR